MRTWLTVISFLLCISCATRDQADHTGQQLAQLYQDFKASHYADEDFDKKQGLLLTFKNTLLDELSQRDSHVATYDSLANSIEIITTKNKQLRIFSWDELNGGSWHVYGAAYQYSGEDSSPIVGMLNTTDEGKVYADATYYQVQEMSTGKFLLMGYGTHGAGKDFYVYRLLSVEDGQLVDCDSCFDGDDMFVFEKPRSFDIAPTYDPTYKTIAYPELIPKFLDGEETGFSRPTGETLRLQYKDGSFIKTGP